MGKTDSDFSSKKETILSFIFVLGLISLFGWAAAEFVLWLLNLALLVAH